MINKVTLKHYLFKGRGSTGPLPIYFRITYARKKAELHSSYTCTMKDWNESDQLTKSSNTINQELLKQRAKIYDLIIELEKEKKPVSASILKDLSTGKSKIQVSLVENLSKFIKELELRNEIKTISINKYKQSRNTIKAFVRSKYNVDDILIDKVNYDFINSYDLFLKQEYSLHKNTINKYHSRLRTVLLRAHSEGIIHSQPYSNFKLTTVKSDRLFLSQDDLNKIIQLDLSANKSLEKVKDIFIFSCYTGLRFNDAQVLTTANLTSFKNKPFLKFVQEKTRRIVDIPLLPSAKMIIEKYKNEPERKVLNLLLPKISNQKLNSYLKVIRDLTGISGTLTHHMARHTFATTICLNNHMPIEDLSKLLGHSSLKTTSIYGRITQQRLSESINKVAKKLKI
jgi:integrase/recombinase XerD